MLDQKLVKILSKVYKYSDEHAYDYEKKLTNYVLPQSLKPNERAFIEESSYELNKFIEFTHDDSVGKLIDLGKTPGLKQKVFNLFIKAIGSGFYRGLQPIVSYLFAGHLSSVYLTDPTYTPVDMQKMGLSDEDTELIPCALSGIPKTQWINKPLSIYHLYTGYISTNGCFEFLLDLEELVGFDEVKPTPAEVGIFESLIALIKQAPADETFSELRNRLSKSKLLPKSNNTSRTWLLKVLAELGILINKFDPDYGLLQKFTPYEQKLTWELELHKAHRIEVEFPISAWRGHLGVNEALVQEVLDTIEVE